MDHTRLNKPFTTTKYINRTNLIKKLNEYQDSGLILVVAPTGYGKSTLISQWLNKVNFQYVWITLNESMNDTSVFLSYLIQGLEKTDLDKDLIINLRKLSLQYHVLPFSSFTEILMNYFNSLNRSLRVVFDDYHKINNQEINSLITLLLTNPSPKLFPVILSRKEPKFNKLDFRHYNQFLILKTKDLKFDNKEVKDLLKKQYQLSLTPNQFAELSERTEGWIMGIHLAVSFETRLEKNPFEKKKNGQINNDLVFIIDQLLSKIDEKFYDQVLLSSVCDKFNHELLDSIFTAENKATYEAKSFIEKLLELNFFLITEDVESGWFRYHHLVQATLKKILFERSPDLVKKLFLHVSIWQENHNNLDESIIYAIKANQPDRAIKVISKYRTEYLNNDQWWYLLRWLNMIPDSFLKTNFDLLIVQLWVSEYKWDPSESLDLLDFIETLSKGPVTEKDKAELKYFYGHVYLFYNNDPQKALVELEESKAIYSDNGLLGAQRELRLAIANHMLGRKSDEMQKLDQEKKLHNASLSDFSLLVPKCFTSLLSLNLSNFNQEVNKLVLLSPDNGYRTYEAWGWYLKSNCTFQKFDAQKSTQAFSNTLKFEIEFNYWATFDLYAGYIIYHALHGNSQEAFETLERMKNKSDEIQIKRFHDITKSVEARLNLLIGDRDIATNWSNNYIELAKQPNDSFIAMEVPDLTKIRILVTSDRKEQIKYGLNLIDEISNNLAEVNYFYNHIDFQFLKTIGNLRMGNIKEAKKMAQEAILLTQKHGSYRPYIENIVLEPNLLTLIKDHNQLTALSLFVISRKLIGKENEVSKRLDILTSREVEVVSLIHRGLSNKEVANQLHISLPTVKSHLTHIYRKLDVSNRTSMLRKITEMGVLA